MGRFFLRVVHFHKVGSTHISLKRIKDFFVLIFKVKVFYYFAKYLHIKYDERNKDTTHVLISCELSPDSARSFVKSYKTRV